MDRRLFLTTALASATAAITPRAVLADARYMFPSIDGGSYDLQAWEGQPLLVVNTASLCGFTDQYADLQAFHEAYAGRARILAVPSDDFAQELGSDAEVAEFCEMHFGLTLPMSTIQSVRGPDAHPFYTWLARAHGFTPRWNFNKALLDANGAFVTSWGSTPDPMSREITDTVNELLSA